MISASTLKNFNLKSRDGEIGRARDFYFDDRHWAIRYLVADTGGWLAHRKVLISPYALGGVSSGDGSIAVDLTQKQIEDSPPLDSDEPVSRQFEEMYHDCFAWPTYWSGPYTWGAYPQILRDPEQWMEPAATAPPSDPHLRSTNFVGGYHVHATDGEIGHIADFLIDEATWAIRYLVIDTRNWWPGKKILVSPAWIDRVSWLEREVFVNLHRDVIRDAPAYAPGTPLTREFETKLHGHYRRAGYWLSGTGAYNADVAMASSPIATAGK